MLKTATLCLRMRRLVGKCVVWLVDAPNIRDSPMMRLQNDVLGVEKHAGATATVSRAAQEAATTNASVGAEHTTAGMHLPPVERKEQAG